MVSGSRWQSKVGKRKGLLLVIIAIMVNNSPPLYYLLPTRYTTYSRGQDEPNREPELNRERRGRGRRWRQMGRSEIDESRGGPSR